MANEINGSDLFVWMSGAVIATSTSHTLTLTGAKRDTSNKDSGIYNTSEVGRFDVSASVDGLIILDGSYLAIMSAMAARVPVLLQFGMKQTGTDLLDTAVEYAHGYFTIMSCEQVASDQQTATYAATFDHANSFEFTPHGSLIVVECANVNAATNASEDGMAAVFVSGGIAPYTFAWDVSLETTNPAVALDGAYDAVGITHTVTVTDSTPVTPLEGTCEIVIFADAAA
jgi:hypothetical protein